jgi:hypothetical protein
VKGVGNQINYGARIFDPRIGRWLKRDPAERKYPAVTTYGYALNNPISAFDPDGNTVYIVVTKYTSEMNENGELIQRPYLAVLDITKLKEEETEHFTDEDKQLYDAYQLTKKTASGKDVLEKYEQSTTDDVYIFQSAPKVTVNPKEIIGGYTKYNVKDEKGDGKFHNSDMKEKTDVDQLVTLDRLGKIEGIRIQDKGRVNSYVSFNPQIVNNKDQPYFVPNANDPFEGPEPKFDNTPSIKNSIETIAHEFIAHVLYGDQGVPAIGQHDKFYGKAGGSKKSYDENSDYGKLMKEIDKAVNKPQ